MNELYCISPSAWNSKSSPEGHTCFFLSWVLMIESEYDIVQGWILSSNQSLLLVITSNDGDFGNGPFQIRTIVWEAAEADGNVARSQALIQSSCIQHSAPAVRWWYHQQYFWIYLWPWRQYHFWCLVLEVRRPFPGRLRRRRWRVESATSLLKLGPSELDKYCNLILPQNPRDHTFDATIQSLSQLFGDRRSLFNTL